MYYCFITDREIIEQNGEGDIRKGGREKAQENIRFGY